MSSGNGSDAFIEISRILPLLPYADQLDAYADIAATGLRESLQRLISSSAYMSHPSKFPDLIHKYIVHFGMRFTKKELVDIINFGLAVAFCPQVDKINSERWKHCVSLLLGLSHNYIKKEELQLEWKTFQNAFMRDVNEFDNCNYTYEISPLDSILIDKANRYFIPSCIQEIWESERPRIYTSLITESFDGIFDHLRKFTPNQLSHFEEIKRVWLGEIFHMWYQYPTLKLHKAVVILLAKFSQHFPGRLDMEPHLDRVFNFLIQHIYDKDIDKLTLTSSAELIVNSIVPGSNVLRLLRNVLNVCSLDLPPANKEAVKSNSPFFCFQLVSLFCKRVNFEFTWIPEMKEHIGEVVEWARLTKEQVDEFVEILLPICFEDAFFSEDEYSFCGAMQTLALLRPRSVIPHVIKSIEEGYSAPPVPLRHIKSLKVLASCSSSFCCPNVFPIWNHYIGFQPTDQIQNYPSDDETSPHIKDPEQREQWKSNFFAMIYPECRFLVPKILYICLKALYFNQGYCLQDSIRTLTYIFMTMPIKRISEMYQSGKNFENDDAISEIQLPSSVSSVEDLVLEIFRRIFKILGIKNRHYQDLIDKGQSVIQPSSIVHDLSFLAIHIAMSANSMPKLRVRLFHAFLVIILQTPWNPAVFSKFPDVLIWLLRGPRCESTDLSESDTALHALQKFWPLFLRLYTELKTGKSITREGNVDSRLVPLLNILQAFFVVFVPSRVEEVRANFITPALDILLDLCETSLGSGGECAPSINLAKYASECLGVLLYRLLTISMDFNGVDFFNSAEYTTNSLWTPFVGYQKAKNLVKWSWPTKKTFFVAKCIIKVFFVPLMRKLAGVTDELSAYVKDKDLKRIRVPHITIHSQQPGITNQRLYLISLISWIWNICISIFEGLKPRDITHEGVNYAKEICSELELLRYGNVACPESSFDFRDFNLDLNFFDFPPYQDESTLRDQIFRYGLRFLDALAGLSMKFDAHTINLPDPTNVQCTIERILDMKQLNLLVKIIVYAGFNYVEYTDDEAYEFNTHPQIPIRTYCLGFYRDYIEPENNLCGKIGPSSELLSALSREEKSSLECGGGGGIYGVSYLPIVWLMCAKRQHFNFIRRAIGLNAAWPGTKALSLITNPRLPANQELNRLIESSLRLALNCNNMDVEEFAVNVYYLTVNEMPGVPITFARLFMELMNPFHESNIFVKGDAEYRAHCYRLKRVISIISLLVTKTAFSIELYNNDPILWSQMWAILLKLCICSNFASTQLMNDQIQERANDQKAIAHACSVALKTLETHSFTLYFHASYEPDTHSKNSPLRHLILSAQKLLITLGGCKETMMIFKPLLLVKTAKLRRDAYRYLIHAIDEVCLINDDVDSNSNFLSFIFLSIDFQTDHWNTHSVYASIPDITSFQKAAPPPPMPSLSTIRTALELLFSKNVDLSFAAGRFITNILVQFYLKARERKFVCVDWRSVEIPKKCEGFENECQYDCLASKNYTLRNHILSLVESPNYFRSTSVWVDPCSCAMFPSFPDSDENTLKADISDNEWLKFRSEIDLSELTHSEISDWRKGIKTIAEFFAKPDSWTQLSQVFLSYHRCSSKNLTKILKLLIQFVLLSFGPHPYLQRVEEFVMTLLQPALTPGPKNDMVMIVGSTLANEILFYVAVGSCSWPRDMKLELFRRVLPRLIFYAEAGSQRASMSAGSTVILSIPLCLNNVSFLQPTNYDAATANESNSYFQEENEVSPANCPLAYAIRYGDWERDEIDSSKEMDVPDPYGPNTQIRSPISEFLRNITTDSIVTAYFPYIWKCISQLASVGNVEHVSIVGDLQCDHNVPGDNGECPICVGCRLFSRVGQRRALKDKMMVEFLNVTHWNKIHLLKHLTDMRMEFWEKKVCGNSLWSQQQAMTVSNSFARAEFNKIRNTAPPTIRYYKIDDTNGDAPKFSEHQAQSALVTELISPLSEFEVPELQDMSLIGPDFIMKRYLPLLVRDLMAVLLLKDVLPSAASFALQNELLSKAAERITPATEELINFPHQIKEFIEKGITPRVLAMVDFLTTIVSSVYPIYVLPNFSSESTFNILCRLAPLLADYVPIMIRDKNNCRIGTRIFEALSLTFESTIIGHTNADLEINQANKMLEFLEAFLLHADCQTRNFGLETMRMIGIPYSTFWKRSDAVDVSRCRLKNCLCKLLEDSSINVAKAACRELSYALKYNMIGYDEEWFRELKEQIRTNETKPEQETEEDILRRRGGVLGLRSIIQAHASNVPDYLPEVITEVAKHAGDPEPIGQIATETMDMYYYSVFRFLTLWDRRKFSAKQHEIIESFISREK